MDYSDPKFQALDKECDALRANYNTKKKEYEELYAAYKAELERIAGLNYFDIALINIISNKTALYGGEYHTRYRQD